MKTKSTVSMILGLFFWLLASQVLAQTPGTVRFVYLVSSDRRVDPEYARGIENAALSLQSWYESEMEGFTFRLNDPVVEIVRSAKPANWFYDNPNGDNQDNWGFNNTLQEVSRILGTRHHDPDYIWVIYSDGPGNSGRGGAGVCIMPENDLIGLAGRDTRWPVARWIGGAGHELGHAFGLPHPPNNGAGVEDAIMWAGFYNGYPEETYLTDQDKEILSQSPFFFDRRGNPIGGSWESLPQQVSYPEGRFIRERNTQTGQYRWVEEKSGSRERYFFTEVSSDSDYYYLEKQGASLALSLPRTGEQSYISTDGMQSWSPWWRMEPLP